MVPQVSGMGYEGVCEREPVMDAAVPRKLAQPYQAEVIHFPKEITIHFKAEYERMNETLEGLKDKRQP